MKVSKKTLTPYLRVKDFNGEMEAIITTDILQVIDAGTENKEEFMLYLLDATNNLQYKKSVKQKGIQMLCAKLGDETDNWTGAKIKWGLAEFEKDGEIIQYVELVEVIPEEQPKEEKV